MDDQQRGGVFLVCWVVSLFLLPLQKKLLATMSVAVKNLGIPIVVHTPPIEIVGGVSTRIPPTNFELSSVQRDGKCDLNLWISSLCIQKYLEHWFV